MVEEKKSQEFKLKNVDVRRNYFVEKIKQNELMDKTYKKVCTILNHIENYLILSPAVTGSISISGFASKLYIPIGITSSAIRLKIYAITAGIKMYM